MIGNKLTHNAILSLKEISELSLDQLETWRRGTIDSIENCHQGALYYFTEFDRKCAELNNHQELLEHQLDAIASRIEEIEADEEADEEVHYFDGDVDLI